MIKHLKLPSLGQVATFFITLFLLFFFYFANYDWTNKILNAVTPITGYLSSNTTSGVTTSATAVTSLISGGFVQGVNALFDTNANSYIAWAWKEDTASGFEHIAYTGTGANRTIAHSLGETPAFMMVKRTDLVGGDWKIYHHALPTPATQHLSLQVGGATTDTTVWNSTLPNSTTFSLGTHADVNANGGSYIAYIWAEKSGFSKFGVYTGNGSADGPFVYTGFKPRYWLHQKGTGEDWRVVDTARFPINPITFHLRPNTTIAEHASGCCDMDILSNGFKMRTSNSVANGSGIANYYAAFAETPFKESGTAYNTTIASSTRFNGTNADLRRTPTVASTNHQQWTYSGWIKRSTISTVNETLLMFNVNGSGNNASYINSSGDAIQVFNYVGGSFTTLWSSNALFRDPSAWYHIVVQLDQTQPIVTDRLKIYVDGKLLTSFSSQTGPDTSDWWWGTVSAGYHFAIGYDTTNATSRFSGYMADVNFLDGISLDATSFGEFDTNGIWKPKAYAGAYGTNGFHLDFSDPANPGNDGNGGKTISSLAFQPDLVWIKATSSALNHAIFDSVQGVGKYLSSNLTAAATTLATTLKSFTSTGFTLGSAAITNTLNAGYVAWNWKESTTSGLDIVSYTGNGANRTIAHNLGVTPSFMLIKRTNTVAAWTVWHKDLTTPTTQYMVLNSTAGPATAATMWNSTTPTSVSFSLGTNATVNSNGASYIAYIFAEKNGFSKMGSYTGNGSADGTLIYTGFKPKYVMIKKSSSVGDWAVIDNERQTYDDASGHPVFRINTNGVEQDVDTMILQADLLSNGFKLRSDNSESNQSGDMYIYVAFAEYPFKEAGTPYNLTVASSTRFNGSTQTVSRTLASRDMTKWATSFWFKKSRNGTNEAMFGAGGSANNVDLDFYNDTLRLYNTALSLELQTTQVFRDPSVWQHLVLIYDSAQATASDRVKIYINGVQITSFTTATYPTLNMTTRVNGAFSHSFGSGRDNTGAFFLPFSGYMSDIYFIDGVTVTPSSFGEFDTNGIWKPKTYSGAYGTNGVYLNFTNAASPGADASGNGNNFTNIALATTDNVIDTPTSNYPTFNPLWNPSYTLSNGNLSSSVAGNVGTLPTTMILNSYTTTGVYWEADWDPNAYGASSGIGVVRYGEGNTSFVDDAVVIYNDASSMFDYKWGSFTSYSATNPLPNYFARFCFAYKNGSLWIGTVQTGSCLWIKGGDPASDTLPNFTDLDDYDIAPGVTTGTGLTSTATFYFTSDRWQAPPPSGFVPLSTLTMGASAVTKSNDYFDVVTYTGTGSGNGFTNNNIATTDNMLDSPTNNFATLNPIQKPSGETASNGNLNFNMAASGVVGFITSTIAVSSGKWYWENVIGTTPSTYVGVCPPETNNSGNFDCTWLSSGGYGYRGNTGFKYTNGTSAAYGATYTSGDVIGVALDMDAGTITFYKNNVSQGVAFTGITGLLSPHTGHDGYTLGTHTVNFGQGGQAGLTYDPASGGYFKYTPPAGFKALSTSNLPASDITKPNDYFDAQTYTGTGAAATRSLFNFEPALLWLKDRTSANNHGIFSTFTTGVVSASLQMFFEI